MRSQSLIVNIKTEDHHHEKVVGIFFEHHPELNERVKQIPGVKYSHYLRAWYIPLHEHARSVIEKAYAGTATVVVDGDLFTSAHHEKSVDELALQEYRSLLVRKRYSPATMRNYESQFKNFLAFINRPAQTIVESDIHQYMEYLIGERRISSSGQNIAINAIKFYLENVENHSRRKYVFVRPVKRRKTPCCF